MKIQRFLESESVAQWDADDLHENRAGRLSAAQRRSFQLRLYQFINLGTMLLGLLLLTIFIATIMVVYNNTRQDFQTIIANGYVIAGLIVPPWIVSILGFDTLCLLLDMRAGSVKRDCGVVRLETRRLPPHFQQRQYVVVGKNRYLLNRLAGDIQEGEHCCVYYAPNTRLVTAVEADASR